MPSFYGVEVIRSPGSTFGYGKSFVKYTRPCSRCNNVFNFRCDDKHEKHLDKTLVFLSRSKAILKAIKLRDQNPSPFISYSPVLLMKSTGGNHGQVSKRFGTR